MPHNTKLWQATEVGPVLLDMLLKAGGEHTISNADFGDVTASWSTDAVAVEMEKTSDGVTVRVVSIATSL